MRSDFLTHWTGKDICTDPARLTDGQRRNYIERVFSTIAHGLWMTCVEEVLVSSAAGRPVRIEQSAPVTCFTELRLSGARPHFSRYGLLGFVFDRRFLRDRSGGPVLYVAQRDEEPLVSNVAQLQHWLAEQRANGVDGASDMMHATFYLSSFLKGMSNPNTDDYAFLDEHEWRIVQSQANVASGKLVLTGEMNPKYRIPFGPKDLRLLILPDDIVRGEVTSDPRFLDWSKPNGMPVLTVSEMEQL